MFISYAREDKDAATKLRHAMDRLGVSVWLDSEQLFSDENWAESIQNALNECDLTAIILSESSTRPNRFISKEWATIQESCWRRPELPVCVIQLDDAKAPVFLREWQSLACKRPDDWDLAAREISRKLKMSSLWKMRAPTGLAEHEAAERFGEIRKALDFCRLQETPRAEDVQ